MLTVTRTGVGTADLPRAVRDSDGSGLLPIQVAGDGATTYRILGRVDPEFRWVELKQPTTADILESVSWVPYIRLEVTAGTGEVRLGVGEK